MPCYDSRNEPEYVLKEARKNFRHNSDVAQLLCTMCKLFEKNKAALPDLPEDVQTWWNEHKARDAKKKKGKR